MKQYSFLIEGWFSKSDEEVANDNISRRSSRELYEDLKTFLEYYRQIFFTVTLLTEENYQTLLNHIVKYHSKVKDVDKLTYNDLDLSGQRMFGIIGGMFDAFDNGLLQKVFTQMRKHLDRFEPDEFKRFYLNTTLDTIYKDLCDYLKQNKLTSLYTKVMKEVNSIELIQWLEEQLKEVKSIAHDQGYNVDLKTVPKMVIKSTIPNFNVKFNKKLPKSISNTIPKNKIRHLKK